MNKTIYLKYPWREEDFITGTKYYFKTSRAIRNWNIIYLVLATYFIVFGIFKLIHESYTIGVISIVIGLIYAFIRKINFYRNVQSIKKQNFKPREIHWEINRDKVTYRMINVVETTFNWESIQGLLDTPKGFLLYPQRNQFLWLPKQAFNNEEDIALFAFIAQDKVKNYKHAK